MSHGLNLYSPRCGVVLLSKIIRDPVHGYIRIPKEICGSFIDTPIFQRLRSIEQTSMRWLFPGGRHDRFIHSLGVHHLADQLYDALEKNSCEEAQEVLHDESLRRTFVVAALMHDCGHAPFSHTMEFLYNKTCSGEKHNRTFDRLKELVEDSARSEFAFEGISKKPADHEAMSALVLLREYGDKLVAYNVNPTLAARMITGIVHSHPDTDRKKIENILIELINGEAIDVDKLDYIIRDTWASGVKNASIDVGRLLGAATIGMDDHGKPRLTYKATALSVMQTVIDARNYLYEWIYGHHTVVYYANLLTALCLKLGKALEKDQVSGDSIIGDIFSDKAFSAPVSIETRHGQLKQYLVNDGDVMSLFKQYCSDALEYQAYISHKPAHVPLWKTEAEYKIFIDQDNQFKFSGDQCIKRLRDQFGMSGDQCFSCSGMSGKLYDIKPSAIKVLMPNGNVYAYNDVANVTKHPSISENRGNPFCYIFIANEFASKKQDMIGYINDCRW